MSQCEMTCCIAIQCYQSILLGSPKSTGPFKGSPRVIRRLEVSGPALSCFDSLRRCQWLHRIGATGCFGLRRAGRASSSWADSDPSALCYI